jgi:hypothetical protein
MKKYEIQLAPWFDLKEWALLFNGGYCRSKGGDECLNIGHHLRLSFLCFGICIDLWVWDEKV